MVRESHLFACHKFLEEMGSQILNHLAKVDFRDSQQVDSIREKIAGYIATLQNHAEWEEEFIYNKFFSKFELPSFFAEHSTLNNQAKKLIANLVTLLQLEPHLRVLQGREIYLNFRNFYASNLMHFYNEETDFLDLLQKRATDEQIRAIDKPIYQEMSSSEMLEMLERLLPPTNVYEKKKILNDLMNFNAANFACAREKILNFLTRDEVAEIFGE